MAEISFPAALRIIEVEHELWFPGRITQRVRNGNFVTPLLRGAGRWRGSVRLGQHGSRSERDMYNLVELFLAEMSVASNWTTLTWAGAPPYKKTPGVDGANDFTAAITAVSGAAGGHIYTVNETLAGRIAVGDWLKAPGGRICQARSISGAAGARRLQVLPELIDPVLSTGASFTKADVMKIQFSFEGENTIRSSLNSSYAGPWTLQWEEFRDG